MKVLTKADENKWVALAVDYKTVVATGETLKLLGQQVEGKKAVVMRVTGPAVGGSWGGTA